MGQHIKMVLFYVSVFITILVNIDDEHIVGEFGREKEVRTDLPSGSNIKFQYSLKICISAFVSGGDQMFFFFVVFLRKGL